LVHLLRSATTLICIATTRLRIGCCWEIGIWHGIDGSKGKVWIFLMFSSFVTFFSMGFRGCDSRDRHSAHFAFFTLLFFSPNNSTYVA